MGEKLTFENYTPKMGDQRVFDPEWQEKYGYRMTALSGTVNMGLTDEQLKYNKEQQKLRQAKYADGLHGYDYYKHAGDSDPDTSTEFEALKRRFRESIPIERWVVSDPVSMKTAEEDMNETFEKLKRLQPPVFMNAHVTAAAKKGLNTHKSKMLDKQLKDYKEMRANWEKSPEGQEWVKEVQRLKDMESGKLKPDPADNLQISAPTGMKRYARNVETIEGVLMDTSKAGKVNLDRDLRRYVTEEDVIQRSFRARPGMDAEMARLNTKYNGDGYVKDGAGETAYRKHLKNYDGSLLLEGTIPSRLILNLSRSLGQGLNGAALEKLFDKLMAPHKVGIDKDDTAAVLMANAEFESGLRDLKKIIFGHLKRLEATYGTLPTQMKADDFLRMAPEEVFDHFSFLQDAAILQSKVPQLFDMDKSDEDKEFKRLFEYYDTSWQVIKIYLQADYTASQVKANDHMPQYQAMSLVVPAMQLKKEAVEKSKGVGGPRLQGKEEEDYLETVKNRHEGPDKGSLFLY